MVQSYAAEDDGVMPSVVASMGRKYDVDDRGDDSKIFLRRSRPDSQKMTATNAAIRNANTAMGSDRTVVGLSGVIDSLGDSWLPPLGRPGNGRLGRGRVKPDVKGMGSAAVPSK